MKPVTKPGTYGTLYLYLVRYTDTRDDCCPTFQQRMWAYNLEHVEDRFYSSEDADGWKIVSIERVSADGAQHRAVKHAPAGAER